MEDQPMQLEVLSTSAIEAQERASCDVQISTAKKYPRGDMSKVKERMLSLATLDQETAQGCFYTLRRDGKVIQGASARLAEIAVSSYKNIRAASRVIDNDGKKITAQAVCHDLENNVYVSVEVQRRITNKDGKTFSEDMQIVTGNAASSIAFRNAVFKVVPKALINPVYEEAKRLAIGDAKSLSQRRDSAVAAFDKMGVDKDRLLSTLGKSKVEDIDLSDIEILLGLHTAIKDGDTTIDESFPLTPKKPIFKKSEPVVAPTPKVEDPPAQEPVVVNEDEVPVDLILKQIRDQGLAQGFEEGELLAALKEERIIGRASNMTLEEIDGKILSLILKNLPNLVVKIGELRGKRGAK